MSRTLFWYILKDLLKIFLLASGALAGIMSFGGLLRPLTEHGLGAGQVVRMLGYFMPAMQTYSLPVAALFATTMVYGRLSADNEITACRAAGISALSIATPAFILGLIVSLTSFVFLYFIVPVFTLKVEKVIYSNIAQLVASQIERNHRVEMNQGAGKPITIFAHQALVLPAPVDRPGDQVVRLVAPVFVTYEQAERDRDGKLKAPPPQDFFMARSATAFISQDDETGEVYLKASLDDGIKFPRRYRGADQDAVQVSIGQSAFYSDPLESPVRENTKFMPLARLQELLEHPEKSRRMKSALNKFIRDDQRHAYLQTIAAAIDSPGGNFWFDAGNEGYVLERGTGDAQVDLRGDKLVVSTTNAPEAASASGLSQQQTALSASLPRLRQTNVSDGLSASAREIVIRATPTIATDKTGGSEQRIIIDIELNDAVVRSGQIVTPKNRQGRVFSVAMPKALAEMENKRIQDYLKGPDANSERVMRLERDRLKLINSIISETHARASFSVSCLILVLVGCALGMMFRSGNFLSAFAVSVLPAGMCILLIVTGQHTCENIPWEIRNFSNPLQFGVTMIWMGNGIVTALALVLLGRLQQQ